MYRYAHITGWGFYVPPRVVTNDELSQLVPTSDSWIRERTGIAMRHIADDTDFTSTMAIKAGRRALEVADVDPGKVELVIVATSTPDYLMPATACLVQDGLGCAKAAAFDLNTACSGFVYALSVGASLVRSGAYDNVLVIGSESMSRVMNWTDRSTCVLFGDGAGAVLLQASDEPGGLLTFALGSDGSGGDLLNVHLGTRLPPTVENLSAGSNFMKMNGQEVFRFATRIMNQATRQVVAAAGLEMSDIDLVVPHQANTRILQTAAKQLGIPTERIYSNVERYGNTSAASVPIALMEAIEEGRVKAGDYLVFVGFGGGLTWGACLVQWTDATNLPTRPMWKRATHWTRYRLAGAQRLVHRLERGLGALDDKLHHRSLNGFERRNGQK